MICAVGGLSCAGKSTFINQLKARYPDLPVISLDSFYWADRSKIANWDVPDAFDFERAVAHVREQASKYPCIFIEGIIAFYLCYIYLRDDPLFGPENMRFVLIDIDFEFARARRAKRCAEMLRTVPGFLPESDTYFVDTVIPAFKAYTLSYADRLESVGYSILRCHVTPDKQDVDMPAVVAHVESDVVCA